MEFEELVRERRSIRGYKPDLMPKKLIRQIVDIASRAPSSMNTQPWQEHANIPETEVIMTCVAMGYPYDDFAANEVRASRVPADAIVSFVGFDDEDQ